MRLRNIALPFLVLCLYQAAYAQDSFHIYNIPFARISAKVQVLDQQLEKQTEKYLYKLQKQERQLQSRLWKKDSLAAKEIFSDIEARYDRLKNSLASNSNVYSPRLGSMQTALRFVQQQKIISDPEVQSLLNNYQQLQKKLNKAAQIRKYLKERQQYLQERLDLTKELRKLQKQVYYYRAQLNEYKQALDDPSKLEAKLLQLANKIPAFKDFFAKNSILSSLFHLPGNDPMALATPIPG
ncbi:MAG TPA: hypothetical protein VEB42_07415, partial [Chitinophagaceae bacterium]|nr:hypothetical protein [Chitinophagaceae bacterium]